VDKNGSVREARRVRDGQGIKEIRTYSVRKDSSGEVTITKTDVKESVPALSESGVDEKDKPTESDEKENVKEPAEKTTDSTKPDKEDEGKSSVSSRNLIF
jgi:hypothetical protein